MNAQDLTSAVFGPLGGIAVVLGGLAGWLGSVLQARINRATDTSAAIDIDLRNRRIAAYQDLWKMTRELPKWPRNEELQYSDLETLSSRLRDWYFSGNGMYLSRATHHKGYSPLQESLSKVLRDKPKPKGLVSTEKPDHYELVRKRCSRLRTELTLDIESRTSRRRSIWFVER